MPSMFSRTYYDDVFGKAVFFDLLGKEHSVFLSRADRKTYLTTGWTLMGSYYSLNRGDYFKMVYLSFGKKNFQVFNNFGDEVYGPPVAFPFSVVTDAPSNPVVTPVVSNSVDVAAVEDSFAIPDVEKDFCHILTKVLTYFDLSREGLVVLLFFVLFSYFLHGFASFNVFLSFS